MSYSRDHWTDEGAPEKAKAWKCASRTCQRTIQELEKDGGLLPWNLTAWYCPGGGCRHDERMARQRDRREKARAEKLKQKQGAE